jgi:hypothetical protein
MARKRRFSQVEWCVWGGNMQWPMASFQAVNALAAAVLVVSTGVYAQTPSPPAVAGKPLVQVKPAAPVGCKLVGTVRGTKLWAGDCVASDLRSSITPAPDNNDLSLTDRAAKAIPPGQK